MTAFQFRPLGSWAYPDTRPRRSRNTFKASWSQTLELLDRELGHLDAHRVVIQADFRDRDLRLDGMPRSDARTPDHPGIILSFESAHGPLRYATDTHAFWQHNVRAIALGLEALRAVDRYGVTRSGEQYTGWKQLTAGSGLTSKEQAIILVATLTGHDIVDIQEASTDPDVLRPIWRRALKKAHPDLGGSTDKLAEIRDAGRILGLEEVA